MKWKGSATLPTLDSVTLGASFSTWPASAFSYLLTRPRPQPDDPISAFNNLPFPFRTRLYACCTQEILDSDTLLTGKHVSVGMYARGGGEELKRARKPSWPPVGNCSRMWSKWCFGCLFLSSFPSFSLSLLGVLNVNIALTAEQTPIRINIIKRERGSLWFLQRVIGIFEPWNGWVFILAASAHN